MKTMINHQFSIALVLGVTLLSGCTIALGGVGAAVGLSRQPDADEAPKRYRGMDGTLQAPSEPWSVGTHVAVGALTGLIIDVIIVALAVSDFGGCRGEVSCDNL